MTPPGPTPKRPPGRYDEPRAIPRAVRVALAGVLGVILLAIAYIGFEHANSGVIRAELASYQVVDAHSVVVRFTVSGTQGHDVTCHLEALDSDGVVVGDADVKVQAIVGSSQSTTSTLSTRARATTAIVVGCGAAP